MKVAFVGDSICAGYPTLSGWRGKVARALQGRGVEFVGLFEDDGHLEHTGMHGHTLDSVLEHLPEVLALRPDVLVIEAAGNALPYGTAQGVFSAARRIGKMAKAAGVEKIFFLTVTDVFGYSETIDGYNIALRDAAADVGEIKVLEVGRSLGRAGPGNAYFSDDAHPSARGYDLMADLVLKGVFGVNNPPGYEPSVYFGAEAGVFQRASSALLEAYPTMPTPVRQAALGIGWTETGFGQSGTWAPNGVPSNNWGGLTYRQGRCPSYIEHGDHNAAGQPVTYKFCSFPTLKDGAIAWYEAWSYPDTLEAARKGDAWGVAKAMKGHGYYTGVSGDEYDRILAYARMLMAGATLGANALGEKLALRLDPPPHLLASGSNPLSFGNVGVLVVTAGIFLGTLYMKRK